MPSPQDYPKLVEQAEKAVSAVKDPELKRIAFQKILDDLLGADTKHTRSVRSSRKDSPPAREKSKRGKKSGVSVYLSELVEEGFFKKQKTISQVKAELENRGHHIPMTSLSGPLQ